MNARETARARSGASREQGRDSGTRRGDPLSPADATTASEAAPVGTVGRGTVAFLCGLASSTQLPGTILSPVLQSLGLSAAGARTHLARMVRSGDLISHRVGRHAVYELAGTYLQEFERLGSASDQAAPPWDGAFHLVLYDIPEHERSRRDALRRAALSDGFRPLRPGVLLGAHAPGAWAQTSLCGRWEVDDATAREAIARSWDLPAAADRIRQIATRRREEEPYLQRPTDTAVPQSSEAPGTPDPAADITTIAAVTRRSADLFAALRVQPPFPAELLPPDHPSAELHQMLQDAHCREIPIGRAAMTRLLALTR